MRHLLANCIDPFSSFQASHRACSQVDTSCRHSGRCKEDKMWRINFRMQKDRSQTTPRLDQILGWFEACVHIISASLWQKYELLQRQICAFTLHHVIYNFQPISLSAMQLMYCHCHIPSSSKCFRWLSHWLLNISGSEHSPLAPSELWAGQTLEVSIARLPH